MRSRFVLPAVRLLVTGALLGWLAASGQLAKVFAQDKKADPPAQTQDNLPAPSARVDAKVGKTFQESTPGVVTIPKAPKGAPNLVIFLIDDMGFGALSTFGGPIHSPALDKLAKLGLTYGAHRRSESSDLDKFTMQYHARYRTSQSSWLSAKS